MHQHHEVEFDADVAAADLQKACHILTQRCLKLAAKWAAEQWMGLPPDVVSNTNPAGSTIPDDLLEQDASPAAVYARTLFELGEYAHAAAVLSETSLTKKCQVETMPPPLHDLKPDSFYLRAYALYMAGERRKEEDAQEKERYYCNDCKRMVRENHRSRSYTGYSQVCSSL
jgi:hypothetical protein